MFDINDVISEKILQAYDQGRRDLAEDIIAISASGNNVDEWIANREKVIDLCFKVVMRNE